MLRTAEEVVSYDYMIDEARGRVLVTVQLLPREKREQTVRIKGSDVRTMLAEKNIIVESDIVGFEFDETNMNPDFNITVSSGIDLNKYELIVNDADDTIYFKVDDGSPLEIPATVEYKTGQTVWLEIPINIVRDRVDMKNKEAMDLADKKRLEKDRKLRLRREKNAEFEATQVMP